MTPTTGDDLIDGTSGDDTIDALAGNDTVNGLDGNDSLEGNDGNDSLSGGAGLDTISGGVGDDTLDPGTGNAFVFGGVGDDLISYAGAINSSTPAFAFIDGGGDADTLSLPLSFSAASIAVADPGNPFGAEFVISETIVVGFPTFGFDLLSVEFVAFTDTTVELRLGTMSGDAIIASSAFSLIAYGEGGEDTVTGSAAGDTLFGGAGADSLVGGDGSDLFIGGFGSDTMDGGAGADRTSYSDYTSAVLVNLTQGLATDDFGSIDMISSIETVTGSGFDDTLLGDIAANLLSGLSGNDFIRGEEGVDTLSGGFGDDTLNGGAGFDTLAGSFGFDTADYSDASSGVSVNLFNGTATTGGAVDGSGNYVGGSLEDVLTNIENINGSAFGDRLISGSQNANIGGGDGGDYISALGGRDQLFGDAGADTLLGGANADTLQGGLGNDVIDGGSAFDTVDYSDRMDGGVNVNVINGVALTGGFVNSAGFYQGGAQEDTIVNLENINGTGFADRLIAGSTSARIEGRGGDDYLFTFSGNDTIFGGDGDDLISTANSTDQLFGEAGNDTLNGGTGFDTLNGGTDSDTADYSARTGGVSVNLQTGVGRTAGALNSGGFYVGGFNEDTIVDVENAVGSNFGDRLVALNAGSKLAGLGGNDNISGLNGADTLIGGAGADTLGGGAGNDIFEFGSGAGADRITDFAEGAGLGDVIRLVGLGASFNEFSEVIAAATEVGADVVFNFGGGNTITVLGATVAGFDSNDFSFG